MKDDYSRFIRRSLKQAQCLYDQSAMQDQSDEKDEEESTVDGTPCNCCEDVYQGDVAPSTSRCGSHMSESLPVMVFITCQTFDRQYNEAEALQRGTLFPALDKPFLGGGCHCR